MSFSNAPDLPLHLSHNPEPLVPGAVLLTAKTPVLSKVRPNVSLSGFPDNFRKFLDALASLLKLEKETFVPLFGRLCKL